MALLSVFFWPEYGMLGGHAPDQTARRRLRIKVNPISSSQPSVTMMTTVSWAITTVSQEKSIEPEAFQWLGAGRL
jgi:hypothetical protein